MSEAQLERSVLENKEREELFAIAEALGTNPSGRAKKADLVTAILRATGVEIDAAPPRARTRKAAAPAAAAAAGEGPTGESSPPAVEQTLPLDAVGDGPGDVDGDASPSESDPDVGAAVATSATASASSAPAGAGSAGGPSTAPTAERQSGGTVGQPEQHGDDTGRDQPERPDGEGGSRRNRRRRGRDRERGERELQGNPVEVPYSGEPIPVTGLLDLRDEGYGFVRTAGFHAGADDVYVSISQVRRFALRRGDTVEGAARPAAANERYPALLRIDRVSGVSADEARERPRFDELEPRYASEQLALGAANVTGRVIDAVAPLGRGSRALLVSPPRSGKNAVVADLAAALTAVGADADAGEGLDVVVLLVDERPEEVAEARRADAATVVAVPFDHPADEQVHVAELVVERAKRIAEAGGDAVVVVDGITRLTRAYNLAAAAGGRAPGVLDPAAIVAAKRFLGAARNTDGAGSLTIVATAAADTGSRMDEAILDELREAATTEIRLDHDLAARRVHPPVDVAASGTINDDRLYGDRLAEVVALRQSVRTPSPSGGDEAATPLERLLGQFDSTTAPSA